MPTSALHSVIGGGSATTARRIVELLRGFSIEATRPNEADLAGLKAALPSASAVYLSAPPRQTEAELIGAAVRLRRHGFEPVPHLAARAIISRQALDDLLAPLVTLSGIRRVLVIAGDYDRATGSFNSAIELIESGILQRHGIEEVGIAGYPEGHPRIPLDTLERALAAKIEACEQTGLRVHIATQFAFDAAAIQRWLTRLRALGIEHPVRIGLAGPTNVSTLLRYAQRCGVRATTHGLTRKAGLIKHLLGTAAPDGIIRSLAEAYGNATFGRVALHFFSFGGVAATARWAAAVAAGRIVLDRSEGFGVEPPT